jgi:hypothetical protein
MYLGVELPFLYTPAPMLAAADHRLYRPFISVAPHAPGLGISDRNSMIPNARFARVSRLSIGGSLGIIMARDLQHAEVKLRLQQSLADPHRQLAEYCQNWRDRKLVVREVMIAVYKNGDIYAIRVKP